MAEMAVFRRANAGIQQAARDVEEASPRGLRGPHMRSLGCMRGLLLPGTHANACSAAPAPLPLALQASALLGPGMPRVDRGVLSRQGGERQQQSSALAYCLGGMFGFPLPNSRTLLTPTCAALLACSARAGMFQVMHTQGRCPLHLLHAALLLPPWVLQGGAAPRLPAAQRVPRPLFAPLPPRPQNILFGGVISDAVQLAAVRRSMEQVKGLLGQVRRCGGVRRSVGPCEPTPGYLLAAPACLHIFLRPPPRRSTPASCGRSRTWRRTSRMRRRCRARRLPSAQSWRLCAATRCRRRWRRRPSSRRRLASTFTPFVNSCIILHHCCIVLSAQ